MVARSAEVPRDFVVQQLRGLPGAPHAGALAQPGNRQARVAAHPEWFRSGGRAHAGRDTGELSGTGRQHHATGGVAPLSRWPGAHFTGEILIQVKSAPRAAGYILNTLILNQSLSP